ncbi:uncharacterized protein LOC8267883 [Ricinus communis]|uniref:uncharacterized protein LOC8267883 n=1 Tax=Ricinus communis TaxID=3988 RepID=UPI00201ADB79|nr:uncharacterized protein LOC8267883 [Ricinus communis]
MAALIGSSKATCHVRSISLPARSHPLTLSVEGHLDRLRLSQETAASPCNRLSGLKDLYDSVEDLLQLPLTQKDLTNEQHRKSVDEVLDGSLKLVDLCSTTRDIFSQMKECLKELESSLRRRKGGESGLPSEFQTYIASRKKLNRAVGKCFRNLKTEKKNHKDSNSVAVLALLRKVEKISVAVFESVLCMISEPKTRLGATGWSVVSKLLQSKRVSSEETDTKEVKKMDEELLGLKSSKNVNSVQLQNVMNGLKSLESTVQEVEEELECVYRQLLKARVAILNMVNH